ncbi:MAG: hypothetical protein ACYC6Y_20650, partial [Thermoguttaceae bacterium]
ASLDGSRGRHVAFDLAKHDGDRLQRRTGAADAAMADSKGDPAAADSAIEAARNDAAIPSTYRGLPPGPSPAGSRPADAAAGPVAGGHQTTPGGDRLAAARAAGRDATPEDAIRVAAVVREDTAADSAAWTSIVSLENSRQKQAIHMVLLVGMSQQIFHRRHLPTDHPEHQQLPPRRR